MLSRIYNFWQLLKNNLWFIPAVFCIGFLFFITCLYYIEIKYFDSFELPPYLFQGSADNARAVTTTLLSAMITMATLSISITIVVLSLAASQLGPRLIKSFLSDRKTKDYIGLFFGTVIACFVLTIILHSRDAEAYTPHITISLVFVMCFINLFILLGFVNHVAQSSIADNVILKVVSNLRSALKRLTTNQSRYKDIKAAKEDQWPKDFKKRSHHIYFDRSGYVQNIDYDNIVEIASEHSLRISIHFKAGHFLVEGEDGVRVYGKTKLPDDIDEQIKDCFIIGRSRTPTQDIEYSIRHLVEIAIRALSPGINDSFTAVHVLDHLSAALVTLFDKDIPSELFYDENGISRLHAKQNHEAEIIFGALEQIRYNGASIPHVVRHMIAKISTLETLTSNRDIRAVLLSQAKGLQHSLNHMDYYVADSDALKNDVKKLIKKLNP